MTEPAFSDALRGLITRLGGDATSVRIAQRENETDAAATGAFAAVDGVLTLGGTDLVAAASAFAA
jgi:hypothetical protein